jgi:biotin transport system substrate-specific component
MTIAARINQTKYDVFRWRYELSIPRKLVLAFGVAILTGLLAQVRLPNPWMPEVPITGQTFAALMAAVFLGKWWGGISMAIFGGLGWAGVPWFSGWHAGITPTGGYILGFIFAALFLGYFTDKYIRSRSFLVMLGLMLIADFILIWVPGLIWRTVWMNTLAPRSVTFISSLAGSALLFPGDILKAVAAAAVARAITPKRAYNGETDSDKWAKWRLP